MILPEIEQSIYQSQEQSGTLIPLSLQNAENTLSKHTRINRELLVSWLFLIGSIMFTFDAILENLRGISFSSLLHIVASMLFTVGSALFIPNDAPK